MSATDGETSEYEWNTGFGDTNYVVNLTVKGGSMLCVEIEETVSNERWSGDFTSQYVEEITHKAGNFKKFAVFCKMLVSAFDKENDSVYVDVLTYADLETLKARKTGKDKDKDAAQPVADATQTGGAASAKSKAQMKRYVILTYRSDFDKVHYPLPLVHEETPNASAMRRTIRRLRDVIETRDKEGRPAEFLGEKDIRSMVANLRQENQELRHRMRQAESRTAKATAAGTGVVGGVALATTMGELSRTNTELMAQNSKLKRQLDASKRDLQAADSNFEKLRIDLTKEVSKWKGRALGGADAGGAGGGTLNGGSSGASVATNGSGGSGMDRLERYGSGASAGSGTGTGTADANVDLRRRVQELERLLKLERMASSQAHRGSSYGRGAPARSATPPPVSRPSGVWSPAAGSGPKVPARQASRSPATAAYQNRVKRQDPYNDPHAKESRLRAAAAAALLRERHGKGSGSSREGTPRSSSNSNSRSSSAPIPRARSVSPAMQSSSRGGRFDPTAYQRAKEERQAQSLSLGNKSPSVRSSGGSRTSKDPTSGYDSADSRGSDSARRRRPASRKQSPSAAAAAAAATATQGQKATSNSGNRRVVRRTRNNSADLAKGAGDAEEGETSRGILSGSDSEDDRLRRRTAGPSKPVASQLPSGDLGGRRAGIAESSRTMAVSSRANDSAVGSAARVKDSIASKTVGDFPFPSGESVSDNEAEAEAESSFNQSAASRSGAAAARSPTSSQPGKAQTSPSRAMRKSRDESMEQTLPASPVSFSHVRSSGYGDLDGYVEASKSPRFQQSVANKPNSPLRSSQSKSPASASPTHTPRMSKEGLSVSFSSEFKKTPGGDAEIQEIDKRIHALQSYLDNARMGLLSSSSGL